MDHGPVDAGPRAVEERDDQIRSASPPQHRLVPSKNQTDRSSSKARRGHDRSDKTAQEGPYDAENHVRTSSEESQTSNDPPTYPQVGARTSAEDMKETTKDGSNSQLKNESRQQKAEMSDSCQRLYKFTLYETNARYWITGADVSDKIYRLLRIDRTSAPGQLTLFEDGTTYDRGEINDVLASIDQGNKSTGGLRLKFQFWGLLGFIRFTEHYYMLIVTKRQQAAMLGGHYIYQIDGTELIPLSTGASSRFAQNRNPEESRFLSILNNLDLTKSFYFSYSYNITSSLQTNIIRQRQAMNSGLYEADRVFNDMFVWNHHLLKPAKSALKRSFDWCLPIIHGFIDQAALDIFGRAVYITMIGRRSRFFAGARFLKRGINDRGYVANDVETEQILSEKLTTSFHAPGPRLYSNPTYTSYVQHRGSIPLYWTQDNTGVSPKPAIDLHLQDPFYEPAALHFDNLFERYGCPVYVLNLIKSRERMPRESKLLVEFQKCIEYLNQSLPKDSKILYKAFDMSRASKTHDGDVIGSLEVIAKEMVEQTGFFRNGDQFEEPMVQNGVARTNCIDCLDRTNAAQFVIGKRAFALQLQALGVIDRDEVDFDTDAANIFTHMFHDHGDTIAVQYGGSHLVNTMATYRKLNQWQSHSRDMVESFKRYYHNSFLDSQRQEAYNLFLGNYIWVSGQPMLWDLPSDYYLHHSDPRAWLDRQRRDYIKWFTPEFLEKRTMPPKAVPLSNETDTMGDVSEYDHYWQECYRPAALSSLTKVYAYRMTSTTRYLPDRPHRDTKYDFSPFKIRLDPHRQTIDSPDKRSQRLRVKILEPQDKTPTTPNIDHDEGQRIRAMHNEKHTTQHNTTTADALEHVRGLRVEPIKPADKAQQHLWTLNQFHTQSLHPFVSVKEANEYDRYISHPLNLPLVLSTDLPTDATMDYVEYIQKASDDPFDEPEEDEQEAFAAGVSDQDLQHFGEFVHERPDPLTVTEDDEATKRYKAYKQWLRGKSLFKQSKVDPEYRAGA